MTITAPTLKRKAICLIYEAFLLLAVLFIASLIFHLIVRDTQAVYFKPLFQCYLFLVMGYYYTWFWTHGGQTLAMQTWKIRVVTTNGHLLTRTKAITRYLCSLIGIISFVLIDHVVPFEFANKPHLVLTSAIFFGFGFLWAFFDRDHQFLHDRLAGTRIIKLDNG
ncbi:MAG: RDD family protein [Nitrosomonas sp.]|nr:MAG: RDD family protein [Nitrosomonas sp.]